MTALSSPVIKFLDDYTLKHACEEDAYQLARVVDLNRKYLRKWLPWLDTSNNAQDSLVYIQKSHSDWMKHRVFYGLIYKKNEIIGAMGFHHNVHKYMALGYWISEEHSKGGICTAASQALLKWAFAYFKDLNLIELRAATENLASRRVAEKLGFKKEGILRQREWLYDHFVDHVVYSLTRTEFNAPKPLTS